jgi:hypothetical protein
MGNCCDNSKVKISVNKDLHQTKAENEMEDSPRNLRVNDCPEDFD